VENFKIWGQQAVASQFGGLLPKNRIPARVMTLTALFTCRTVAGQSFTRSCIPRRRKICTGAWVADTKTCSRPMMRPPPLPSRVAETMGDRRSAKV